MKRYTHLFFDLDGTLTDSAPGVINGVRYALENMQLPVPDERVLRLFVGPPLTESFHELAGVRPEEVSQAIEWFRKYYIPIGSFENCAFPGIHEVLAHLKSAGYILGVATSKLESQAFAVLARYQLEGYFDAVAGAEDHVCDSKAAVLEKLMQRFSFTQEDRSGALMIGDRKYDVIGARAVGIDCMSVGYGYAPADELDAHPADLYAATVLDIERILCV